MKFKLTGGSRWNTRYYPFGEMFTTSGSGNNHTFTGKELDGEMGLNYSVFCSNLRFDYKIENPALRGFCQRYYDPELGRFMELDPQGGATSSPYAYCVNNPLGFTDPTGEAMEMCIDMLHPGGSQSPDYYGMGWSGGFASWFGSMASYMQAHPDFFAMVYQNEYDWQMQKYWAGQQIVSEAAGERVTTEFFWNRITQDVGTITTTEILGYEVALNTAQMYNLLCDAAANFGPPTVLREKQSIQYRIELIEKDLKSNLIVDEIFWMVVTLRLKATISGEFPIGVEFGGIHPAHHKFFDVAMRHIQINFFLRHISGAGIPIRIPLPW